MFKHTLTRRCLAVGLLVAAASFPPTASARINFDPAGARNDRSPQPTIEVVRVGDHSGFDWGDAGIGAAGGLGLSILAGAGVVALNQRRERRPKRSAVATS